MTTMNNVPPLRKPGNSRGPILRYDSIFRIRLSRDEAAKFKEACERDGVTQTEVIRYYMSEFISGKRRLKKGKKL